MERPTTTGSNILFASLFAERKVQSVLIRLTSKPSESTNCRSLLSHNRYRGRLMASSNGAAPHFTHKNRRPFITWGLIGYARSILQASKCNAKILAKIFGSLPDDVPFPGLTVSQGDTAGVLRATRSNDLVGIDSVDEIVRSLSVPKRDWRQGETSLTQTTAERAVSRRGRSQTLASLLEKAVSAQCEAVCSPLAS